MGGGWSCPCVGAQLFDLRLSKANGQSWLPPSANTLVPPSIMPTCSRAQHSEKSHSKRNASWHLCRGQCKATLKGSVFYCNHRDWQLDILLQVLLPPGDADNVSPPEVAQEAAGIAALASLSYQWPKIAAPVSILFFPRVRTPCGRSAQVIIEGKGNTT